VISGAPLLSLMKSSLSRWRTIGIALLGKGDVNAGTTDGRGHDGARVSCSRFVRGLERPSVSQFRAQFGDQKASFQALGLAVASAIANAPKQTNTEIADNFSSLATRATAQAAALRKLSAPSNYKSQLGQLATDFDTVASDLKAVSGAASAGNPANARSSAEKLVLDAAKLKSADTALTQALGLAASG
jgi:hypothetical protein